MFKMDHFGNGVLIERSRLNEVTCINEGYYTFDKFRYMCIMSGCDYLPSLNGIGLGKASKVFKLARQADLKIVSVNTNYRLLNIIESGYKNYYKALESFFHHF